MAIFYFIHDLFSWIFLSLFLSFSTIPTSWAKEKQQRPLAIKKDSPHNILKCLGEEETKIYKENQNNILRELNEIIINDLILGQSLVAPQKIVEEICKAPLLQRSWIFTFLYLSQSENFTNTSLTKKITPGEFLFQLLSFSQRYLKTHDELDQNHPWKKKFISDYSYIKNAERPEKQIMPSKTDLKKLIDDLASKKGGLDLKEKFQ